MDDSSGFSSARLRFRPASDRRVVAGVERLALVHAPLEIWAASDGRTGVEDQVLGLAEAIARLTPAHITTKIIRWADPGYGRRPTWLQNEPRTRLAPNVEAIEPPWPDLWIAAGRATLPFSLRLRRWSQGQTFVVQAQDPRWPSRLFDAVVPPRHDKVTGPNVIEMTGAAHRVTPATLQAAYDRDFETFESLPRPRVAVLIGGGTRHFDISPDRAARLSAEIALAVESEGGSVLLRFAPGTPEPARDVIAARLGRLPSVIWDGTGADPRMGFLAAADYVLVTEDLTALASEAAATGAPVFVLKIDGAAPGRRRFHEELERLDVARPFGGQLYRWTYEPLAETDRAAARILRRMRDRASGEPDAP